MVMYVCPKCERTVRGGEKHVCKPKLVPFNVVMTDEDKQKLK